MTNSRLDAIRANLEMRSSEELLGILRERDEREWQPEVFDLVASILETRGLAADTSASRAQDVPADEAPSLVTVGQYLNPAEAHAAGLALEHAGIAAWVADDTAGLAAGARLQVRTEDEDGALEVLEGIDEAATGQPGESEALPTGSSPPDERTWMCVKCHQRVAETFDACWNCGTSASGLEAPDFQRAEDAPDVDHAQRAQPLLCPRCDLELEFAGTERFRETSIWDTLSHAARAVDAYLCPRCGHLELFAAGVGEHLRSR